MGGVLNPYAGKKAEEFLLPDGHHLNNVGNTLVYDAVCKAMKDSLEKLNVIKL